MKVNIGRAAKELGVSIDTLRRWERQEKIIAERTPSGHRRYDLAQLMGFTPRLAITVFSARLYGSRSRKNKKLLDQLREAASHV